MVEAQKKKEALFSSRCSPSTSRFFPLRGNRREVQQEVLGNDDDNENTDDDLDVVQQDEAGGAFFGAGRSFPSNNFLPA